MCGGLFNNKVDSSHITVLNETRLPKVSHAINRMVRTFDTKARPMKSLSNNDILYHYTSIDKLFSILDGDSFWASRSRFSNDSTEDKVMGQEWISEQQYYGDNYIISFCEDGDILSQWRGYCYKGGASIGLKFNSPKTYTVCKNNKLDDEIEMKAGKNVDLYMNCPLPVIYCQTNFSNPQGVDVKEEFSDKWDSIQQDYDNITIADLVPYLKNSCFSDELEYRLVFDNTQGDLEEFVQFRVLDDGTRIPYLVVRYGNLLERGRLLKRKYTKEYISNMFKERIESPERYPIIIPCGADQKEICRDFSKHIYEHKKTMANDQNLKDRWKNNPQIILCEGHLPIVSITVAPCLQQEHLKEVIERFCRSRYWLQNVEVNCSKIPYISPN